MANKSVVMKLLFTNLFIYLAVFAFFCLFLCLSLRVLFVSALLFVILSLVHSFFLKFIDLLVYFIF